MDFRTTASSELNALVDRLTAAAEAAARSARDRAAAEAKLAVDTIRTERDAVKVDRDSLRAERDTLKGERDAARAERDAFKTERDAATVERSDLERALREETRARQALEQANAVLEEARAASDEERDMLRAMAEAARDQHDSTRHVLQARLDEALLTATEVADQTRGWRLEQGRAMRDHAVSFVSQSLDHILALSSRFADVSTEDEVLAAMVAALATEFSRVALFKVSNGRVDAVRHVGFDFPADPTHLVIPHVIDALLDRVVTSGQLEVLPAEVLPEVDGTLFGGTAACALALPIDLTSRVCAVLYADDSDQPHQAFASTELRRKFALLLRQIASPLLMRLPAEEKAVTELREYAVRLVTELENLYQADVATRMKGQELRRRLQENLDCARDIYAQRVASEPAAAALLLEEELAAAVARARSAPYGRDLGDIVESGDRVIG